MSKYEVQKGRTVTCRMGVAHEGAILTADHFSGDDDVKKQKKLSALVKMGTLKTAPLTDAEKEALEKTRAAEEAAASANAEKNNAILEADFDEMNKQPMIDFAEEWGIDLKETLADEIREELKALQDSLTK